MTALPLLASSDIIESLFGNFKHIIERGPQADMNRMALLIPALCGNLGKTTITQALGRASHRDLEMWEQEKFSLNKWGYFDSLGGGCPPDLQHFTDSIDADLHPKNREGRVSGGIPCIKALRSP